MALAPTAGMTAILSVQASGASSFITVPGINWKFNIDPKNRDVSNFRDGRVRTPTLGDSDVSLQTVHDQNAPLYAASAGGVVVGASGSAKLYVDASHYYEVGIIVDVCTPSNNGVEDVVMHDVTLKQSGTLIYPTG